MTASAEFEFPGNRLNLCNSNTVNAGAMYLVNGGYQGDCGLSPETINTDRARFTVAASITCSETALRQIRAISCPSEGSPFDCAWPKTITLDFPGSPESGCPQIPADPCSAGGGGAGGASGMTCPLCHDVPGPAGCAVSADGGGSCKLDRTAKAQLYYFGGGVGGDGMPGAAAWRTTLGRSWSHDFAERVVVDPNSSHVWLLTREGGFHEFSSLASGTGLRLYQTRAPSDELRKLYFDTPTATWQLHWLDGRKDFYRSDGQWEKTTLAQDPTHPTQGTYNASDQLVSVSFPDGRSDELTYFPSGKLETITEHPVGGPGALSRTWTFVWSGDELQELQSVQRPDGTTWQLIYDPTRPGYLTRIDLTGSSGGRVVAAFSYLSGTNRVERSWRGDASFTGPNAVDKVTYAYTNPALPTQVVVARTVSATFDRVTTYALGRDTVSSKPKVTSIQGSCPTCGLSPVTSFAYAGSNPLLPSSMTDAKGTRTDYTYTTEGRLATKIEAANLPALSRTTSYTYDANFRGLLTRVEVPSTLASCVTPRRSDAGYDPTTGVLTSRSIDGCEGGASLPEGYKTTSYTPNASGEVLTIDPPGYGTADATTFTYNLDGRNGHVADTRKDPNPPGAPVTTTFVYDGLNRRTEVLEPNGDPDRAKTTTSYDTLSRVLVVTHDGATPADTTDDLVTSYTYTPWGDLFCTKLPRGNGIEYGYDAMGRLTSVMRGTAVGTPTSTSCLDPAQPRERTQYQLDNAGNRVDESREKWTGSTWASAFHATRSYTCHLDKTTLGAGSSSPSVTEYCYDVNDNLEKVWDANHPTATYTNPTQLHVYDELNRLTATTVGPGTTNAATTQYTYDVQDHLASVTDAEGNQTAYTTSDRDLLTKEESPVFSGATAYTTHEYNEHGDLKKTVDPRLVETNLIVDAAGRVTQETFGPVGTPDPTLTNTYTYGSTPSLFNVGRLTGITRNSTVSYTYDRFGRLTQDGQLAYEYDKNGYRTRILYPSGLVGIYTPDFADRDSTLAYDDGSGAQDLVTQSTYAPSGPLTSLTLGNALVETRDFDTRYFPDAIAVDSKELDWDYTVDGIGNPTGLAGTLGSITMTGSYAYQDYLYFLTQAVGPWGTNSWTYDKIGNRMASSGTSLPSRSYSYSASGHGPRLEEVTEAASSTEWDFDYDAAGNQVGITKLVSSVPQWTTSYNIGSDGHLADFGHSTNVLSKRTVLSYDGRGLLIQAGRQLAPGESTFATYGSGGDLFELAHTAPPLHIMHPYTFFYFAGRPVARFSSDDRLAFITTDHLGTPVLVTADDGSVLSTDWTEPFRPQTEVRLQYPGQWVDTPLDIYHEGGTDPDGMDRLFHNVHRWYQPATGRYSSPDPLDLAQLMSPSPPQVMQGDSYTSFWLATLMAGNPRLNQSFGYAAGNPLTMADPFGLSPAGAIAQAGGACILADGPLLFGDVIGVPLVLIGAALVVADWWDNTEDCDRCNRRKLEEECYAQYTADIAECQRRHSIRNVRYRAACYASASQRFGNCMAGRPLGPLSP